MREHASHLSTMAHRQEPRTEPRTHRLTQLHQRHLVNRCRMLDCLSTHDLHQRFSLQVGPRPHVHHPDVKFSHIRSLNPSLRVQHTSPLSSQCRAHTHPHFAQLPHIFILVLCSKLHNLSYIVCFCACLLTLYVCDCDCDCV
jgi:hypothetical protein